ncbi:MAG TPA: class A beta-lactamase-related serine hydrolase [Hellea balneolensis]|uniref:Class A beta-lactamase-related serine hydrolase n=1 Tax=Hellea balneolensis TaxID=287478 RepID=A0A7C5LZR1_9PROT|nr:class A beta-lactamase-related serine hydrolase [Hellea balneolensis]
MHIEKYMKSALVIFLTVLISACSTTSKPDAKIEPSGQHSQIPAPIAITPTTLRNERIDSVLQAFVREGQTPGVSVLIFENGQETYFGKAGYSDKEAKTPVSRLNVGRYYSMTKPIVGVALMRLYEQGKFQLDDPISKYLPEFKAMQVYNGENEDGSMKLVPAKRPITIRDLMRHTSGFTYGFGNSKVDELYRNKNLLSYDQTNAEFTKNLATLPLLYQPGSHYNYSVSVDVQGRLIEVLSGKTLAEYLQTAIFNPLGMSHTGFKVKPEDKHLFTPVYGYGKNGLFRMYDGHKGVPLGLDVDRPFLKDVAFESGGGGLVSTIDDYAKFANMLLRNDGSIIKPSTLNLMSQDQLGTIPNGDLGVGSGFGLDFAVKTLKQSQGAYHVPQGSFYWGGMAGTAFLIDRKNNLVFLMHKQVMNPNWPDVRKRLAKAIYGQ